ncbi:MAG: hypothetical protein F6J89_30210 [Symploca sp. SIO1C4]|uniref:Uncharacterized protein n=1 Tax=Symploca sp. SIO1C4 TaxID=2607765 RepID=A0A6B3NJ44_9CYAN|nr:hypothetical protein [Symploca sp. SIO1C4]NET53277.1 hypothetical protein [Merismopedia sp. SIO2A8]
MTQTRIVLRGGVLERCQHLMEVTQIASLSELVNVMFSRYGKHLELTWEVQPEVQPLEAHCASPEPTETARVNSPDGD